MEGDADRLLIVGVGNEYLGDEGLGVHVVRALEAAGGAEGPGFQLLDAGIVLLDFLPRMARHRRVILVDAIRAGGKPGTVYQVDLGAGMADQVSPKVPLSLHQWGVTETLRAAELLGLLPDRLSFIGAEPESVEPGEDLSPPVQKARDRIVALLMKEIGSVAGRPPAARKVGRP